MDKLKHPRIWKQVTIIHIQHLIPIPKSPGNSANPKTRKDNSGSQNHRSIVPKRNKERMINKRLICYFGNQQFNNKPSIWFSK